MIRRFQAADAEAVSIIDGLLFPDLCWNSHTVTREAKLGWALVAEEQGEVVGYLMARFDSDLTDIIRLGLHPQWQGKGIGRALLRHAIEKVAGVIMLTVLLDNKPALALYISEGFKPQSEVNGAAILLRSEG